MRSFFIIIILFFSVLTGTAQFSLTEKSTRAIELEQYKKIEFFTDKYDDLLDKKNYPINSVIEINRHTIIHKRTKDTIYHLIKDIEIISKETAIGYITNIKTLNLKNDRDTFFQIVELKGNIFIVFFEYSNNEQLDKQIIFNNMFFYVKEYQYIKYKK